MGSDARAALTVGRRRRQRGQGLSEYALLLGLIAILAIGGLSIAGDSIAQTLAEAGSAIAGGVSSAPPSTPPKTPKPTKAPKTPKP